MVGDELLRLNFAAIWDIYIEPDILADLTHIAVFVVDQTTSHRDILNMEEFLIKSRVKGFFILEVSDFPNYPN